MSIPIAHGWEVRQAYAGAGAAPAGNRMILCAQNAIFVDGMIAFGGEGDEQAVDFCRWLLAGASTGTVWVSSYLDDHSYRVAGATAVKEVGTTARSALSGAGFTISESTDVNDTITYPSYDVAIVGAWESFGQSLGDDDARADMLVDFVNDGGGLILTKSNQANVFQNIHYAFGTWDSSTAVQPGSTLAYLTGATALNPALFPSGRTIWKKLCHWVSVSAPDENHAEYSVDGLTDPYRQYAVYSAHGDA
jgi:hypothetical protein